MSYRFSESTLKGTVLARVALVAVLMVACFVRLYKLGEIPAGFFCDEASFGVNAHAILTKGVDEFGVPYPIFFRSFGDYKEAIPIYSVVPFIHLFGLSEWSVRLMSVLYGLINIIWLYFIGKTLRNRWLGVLSAYVGAMMPWLYHYDRVAFHCSPYLTMLLGAVYCVLSLPERHPLRVVGFFVFLSLSVYTYSPSKLMVPLILLAVIWLYRRELWARRSYTGIGIALSVVILMPFGEGLRSGEALGRVSQLQLLDLTTFSFRTIQGWLYNYRVQLLPSTLFVSGEPTSITRHLGNFFPPLLAVSGPFLGIGVAHLLLTARQREHLFLLFLLCIFPLGAVLTGHPFTHRSVLGAPLVSLCTAMGIQRISDYWGSYRRVAAVCLFLSVISIGVNGVTYFQRYIREYPLVSSGVLGWQFGPREIIGYFREHSDEYDELVMQQAFNAPEVFFSFYAPDGLCTGRCFIGGVAQHRADKRQLFAVTPSYFNRIEEQFEVSRKHIVRYPNGQSAFVLATITPRAGTNLTDSEQ